MINRADAPQKESATMLEQVKNLCEAATAAGISASTRVPYTQHHDFVRQRVGGSRSEIATFPRDNDPRWEEALWAGAFLSLIENEALRLLEIIAVSPAIVLWCKERIAWEIDIIKAAWEETRR